LLIWYYRKFNLLMFPTSFLIAVRRLLRNKAFSLLNVLGLSIGVGASILIFLVIRWETSYDSYHPNKDRIYRVVTTLVNRSNGEVTDRHGSAPVVLGDAVRNDISGLEKTAMLMHLMDASIYYRDKGVAEEKRFMQRDICLAEPELFSMIHCDWLDGDASGLRDPNTAVVSETVANRWFGDWKNARGKTVEMWSWRVPLKIVGVFHDLPGNTDIPLELVASYATYRQQFPWIYTDPDWHWVTPGSQLYVLLSPDRVPSQVEAELSGIVRKYYNEQVAAYSTRSVLSLQPLTKMHLDSRFETLKGDGLSPKVLWSLGTIGVFLVLVACINFINLATAQSVNRSKEVGVRKVLGSDRGQLIRQFMGETLLITVAAMVLGCLLVQFSLPYLQQVTQKPIVADWFHSPALLLYLLVTGCSVVLLAGFYPAIVLSGFNVIEAVKSRISTRTIGGLSLRRSLVVVQFVIAQLLMTGTIVVVQQLKFFRTQPMGYDPSAIAILQMPSDSADALRQPFLKSQMQRIPGVESVSLCNEAAAGGSWTRQQRFFYDRNPVSADFKVTEQVADEDFLSTFKIPLVAGVPADTGRQQLMVNETLVRRLGLHRPEDIVGKTLALDDPGRQYRVTGVVRDYHNQSLRQAVEPMVLFASGPGYNLMTIRLRPGSLKPALAGVQAAFARAYPNFMYDQTFFDTRIAQFYVTEATTASLVKAFAGLAIVISCIGLYGLVAFLSIQKRMEVGVRRVLGASVGSIVYLFSREFTVLTGVAFLISAPVGYAVMQRWLASFYYHISLGWGVFALTLSISLLIAWGTVGYKALRAARANPINSLRSE